MTNKKTHKVKLGKEDKQVLWVIIVIVLAIGGFLGAFYYIKSLDSFEFIGLKFEKVKEFDIDFYHGEIPLTSSDNKQKLTYNIWLRNDPRTNKIPINAYIIVKPKMIITYEPDVLKCNYFNVAHAELSRFLGTISELRGGVANESLAEAMNLSYATCEDASSEQSVIIVKKSDTPSIDKAEGKFCYEINVGKCENLKSFERVIMSIVAQGKSVEI